MTTRRASALLVALSVVVTSAQHAGAPVEARVPVQPIAFAGSDGLAHLGYELYLTNYYKSTGALRLERVEVFGDDGPTPLLRHNGDDLRDWVVHPGDRSRSAGDRSIQGGMGAVIYLWVTLKPGVPVPASVRHRLVLVSEKGAEEILDGAPVSVRRAGPVVFGPPIRGGIWLAHEGPGNPKSHHWGSQLALNGRVTIPQRFAIDLIGLDPAGSAVKGDFKTSANEDWTGFGAEVLAVADGVVRGAHDGSSDNPPLAALAPPEDISTSLYGNHVVLDLGTNLFVHYAHLQRNSVTVKIGDRVRRGQVLGRVGSSGNSNAAHLHLQLADAATFQAEGLPFVLESFELLGETTAARAIGAEPDSPPASFAPARRQRELPLHGAVIRFP